MRRTRLVLPIVLALLALAARPFDAAAANDPLQGRQWGLQQAKAPAAWSKATGLGVTIAVVDSGVDAHHPELAGRLLPGASWIDCGTRPVPCSEWDDRHGHGTHVAGIAAAPRDGRGVVGVAPDARILPVRVLDEDNGGFSDDVGAGIRWAVDHGADVINVSVGGLPFVRQATDYVGLDDFVSEATEYALSKNVLVVFSAGNESVPVCDNESLARAQGALCVGSVDRRGVLAAYTNYGYGIDVVAGGGLGSVFCDLYEEDVLSTFAVDTDKCDEGLAGYRTLSGTSMAAPHVTGVAALLAQRGVRGRAAGERIRATATDLGVPGADPLFGAGLVNAAAALG